MSDNLHIITEVGVFGDLDINDPTVKKVKKNDRTLTESELQTLIEESVNSNASIKI